MSVYTVKWKGQSSGPYSLNELKKRFEDREIGAMHEVFVDGHWMTLRAFFRRHPDSTPQTTRPADVQPAPDHGSTNAFGQQIAFPTMPVPPPQISPAMGKSYGHAMSLDESSGPWFTGESASLVFAGFWMRAIALLIDGILVIGGPLWILDYFLEREILTLEAIRSLTAAEWGIFALIALSSAWIYSAVFECSPLQATPGKRWVGLVVISTAGGRIPFATAALRSLAKVGSAGMGFVGFFLAAFTPQKQTFHDMMAHTFVCLRVENDSFFSASRRTL